MGKTESIKERRVDVYLDTLDRKERWTSLADDADKSLSKFVQKCVEYAFEHGGPNFAELGELVFRKRASKRLETYRQGTHVVSALHRYQANDIERGPGQDVQYVVVDDGARLPDRVRLPFEESDGYDVEIYAQEMIRAAESIVSPMGWDRDDIRRRLRDTTETTLQAFD